MSLLINEPVEKDVQVMYYRLPMVALQGTINQFAGSSRQLGGQGVAWHDSASKSWQRASVKKNIIHFSSISHVPLPCWRTPTADQKSPGSDSPSGPWPARKK
jgi:hypothetical protein